MLKTYTVTDKNGNTVGVSDEYIETAVRIYRELVKLSPSGRVSWKKHHELMAHSGFDTSEMGSHYQDSIRYYSEVLELDKVDPIKAIQEEVGLLYNEKRKVQNQYRELNKQKRNIADDLSVIDCLKQSLSDLSFDSLPKVEKHTSNGASDYVGIFCPSDWHIGLGNITEQRERVREYLSASIKYFLRFGITEIKVVGLGDIIENAVMHSPTSTEACWGSNAEQVNEYISLMVSAMVELSQHFTVEYLGDICGNHDENRANGQKGAVLMNDSYSFIATHMIDTLINTLQNPNLTSNLTGYSHDLSEFEVLGYKFVADHGDKSKKGTEKLNRYSSQLRYEVNYVLTGHVHQYKVEVGNYGNKVFTSGTLNDSNAYAKGLGYYSTGSQMIVIVNKHGAQSVYIDTEIK